MSQAKPNMAKRFFFLSLFLTILTAMGFFALMGMGKSNPDSVTPEFFSRIGTVFGGIGGLLIVIMIVTAVMWAAGRKGAAE